jgi:fumarate reductase flavoprotein subunit
VVFSENQILDIIIGPNDETGYLGDFSMDSIKRAVLEYQTVNVDAVAGASVSSGALLAALRDAVTQAGGRVSAMPKQPAVRGNYSNTSTQVVVVGSGAAGLSATIEAYEQGLDVILVEQMGLLGGSSARAGYLMGGGTKLQQAQGVNYSTDDFVRYMTDLGATGTGGGNRSELDQDLFQIATARRIGEMAGQNVDWLQGIGVPFTLHNQNQFRGNGSRVGPFLVRTLHNTMDQRGIDYRLNTRAEEIVMENGKAVGVKVRAPNGSSYTIRANAVIVATGGYNANNDLVKRFNPKYDGYPTDVSKGADGSGLLMVEKVGGVLKYMDQANYHSFATVWRGASRNMASTISNGSIAVNKEGRRFVNETTYYDESCCRAILSQTGGVCYVLFDQSVADIVITPGDNHLANNIDMYKVADTIEELARKLEIDSAGLANTINAYRASVAAGKDGQFGRPVSSMRANFMTGPFYGCEAKPELHTDHGGVVVNIDNQVLTASGSLIPGLYAIGEVAASHVAGSTTHTACVVHGRVAVRAVKTQIQNRG